MACTIALYASLPAARHLVPVEANGVTMPQQEVHSHHDDKMGQKPDQFAYPIQG